MMIKEEEFCQEVIEDFFYHIMAEMRDQNIPILNDFTEVFANIGYKHSNQNENDDSDDSDENEENETNENCNN